MRRKKKRREAEGSRCNNVRRTRDNNREEGRGTLMIKRKRERKNEKEERWLSEK